MVRSPFRSSALPAAISHQVSRCFTRPRDARSRLIPVAIDLEDLSLEDVDGESGFDLQNLPSLRPRALIDALGTAVDAAAADVAGAVHVAIEDLAAALNRCHPDRVYAAVRFEPPIEDGTDAPDEHELGLSWA
jgi:hypothetical protein